MPLIGFRHLPVWIEIPGLRAVHACWHEPSRSDLKPYLDSRNCFTEDGRREAQRRGSTARGATSRSNRKGRTVRFNEFDRAAAIRSCHQSSGSSLINDAPWLLPTQNVGGDVVLSTNTRRMLVASRQRILGDLAALRADPQDAVGIHSAGPDIAELSWVTS